MNIIIRAEARWDIAAGAAFFGPSKRQHRQLCLNRFSTTLNRWRIRPAYTSVIWDTIASLQPPSLSDLLSPDPAGAEVVAVLDGRSKPADLVVSCGGVKRMKMVRLGGLPGKIRRQAFMWVYG